MANWITHMMIADRVLEQLPWLELRGFCVGNIAPDCNVENEDWTAFSPPREVTHWMSGERKTAVDCERFWQCCIAGRIFSLEEERSFFLGYYSHLITDAAFQRFIRDENRVRDMLERIAAHADMVTRMPERPWTFDSVKKVFSKRERLRDVDAIEFEYLREHPQSGYLTVLQTLTEFPDYIDDLPPGAIVRKIGVMGGLPEPMAEPGFVFFTRDEYRNFVNEACAEVIQKLNRIA